MGLFGNQFANVVEWNESEPGVLFYKWPNQEIKKGSKLIIRPGQDAIFMYNGCTEGVFEAEGNYDIESQIIPFLTTLKSFKFAFNTPLRAEVLFINTKEILAKWGTKNAVNIPAQGLPGGMPIRAFGTYNCVNSGNASRLEYVQAIVELAGLQVEVRPSDAASFNRKAKVSNNEMAECWKSAALGWPALPLWRDSLARYLNGELKDFGK